MRERLTPSAGQATFGPSTSAHFLEGLPVKCTGCQHENPSGQEFCGECGTRLAPFCSTCGSDAAAVVIVLSVRELVFEGQDRATSDTGVTGRGHHGIEVTLPPLGPGEGAHVHGRG
jgi:hypothetical protein